MTKNSRQHIFTVENINDMATKLDLKNKDILTVTNSGDQALNFLLAGANSVKLFDKYPENEYYFYLKKALIENLSYQEFFNFFLPGFFNKKDFFAKEKFDLIKDSLPEGRIREYWEDIFKMFSNWGMQAVFTNAGYNRKDVIRRNNYLNSENNYNMLKERLKGIDKVDFKEIDILHEILYLKDKVDFIYLSDILNYIPSTDKADYLKKLKAITLNISNNLNEDGRIAINYMHCYLDEYWHNLRMNIQSIVSDTGYKDDFLKDECDIVGFKGGYIPDSNRLKDRDAVIVYHKNKIKKKIKE